MQAGRRALWGARSRSRIAVATLAVATAGPAAAGASASFAGLGDLPRGAYESGASGITPDGAVVVGAGTSARGREAFRWTARGGLRSLGDLAGSGLSSEALDVSGDGAVIVGRAETAGGTRAFVWDERHGMRELGALLAAAGVERGGWTLDEATAVSADGRAIAGTGTNPRPAARARPSWRGFRSDESAPTRSGLRAPRRPPCAARARKLASEN